MVKEKKNKRTSIRDKTSDHGRGFGRTKKQWENSFADHVGKFIDRLTVRDVLYGLAFLGGTYAIHSLLPKAQSYLDPDLWQVAPFVYTDRATAEAMWIGESLVGAYMLLKIDADDITSAARAVGNILTVV